MKKTITIFAFSLCICLLIRTLPARAQVKITQFPTDVESFENWVSGVPRGWVIPKVLDSVGSTWIKTSVLASEEGGVRLSRTGLSSAGIYPKEGEAMDDWLISPLYKLPTTDPVQFQCYLAAFLSGIGKIEVRLSEGFTEKDSFKTVLLTDDSLQENLVGYVRQMKFVNIDLSAYKGKEVRIAFRALSASVEEGGAGVFLDDMKIISSTYLTPTQLTISEIGFNDARVSWNGEKGVPYEFVYSMQKLANPLEGGMRFLVTDTFFQLEDLRSSTPYYVYLRTKGSEFCGGEWVGPYTFKTLCSTLMISREADPNKFFVADFTNLNCWAILNRTGGGTWTYEKSFIPPAMVCNDGRNSKGVDDWLVMPEMRIPSGYMFEFSYDIFGVSAIYNEEAFSIWFIKDTADPLLGAINLRPRREYRNLDWYVKDYVDLSPVAGLKGRIAFRVETRGSQDDFRIESMAVVRKFPCMPVEDIFAEDLQLTTANLRWISTASSFEIYYSDKGDFTPDGGIAALDTLVVNENRVVLSSLKKGTNYKVFVRAVCDQMKSEWRSFEFRTPNRIETYPYFEDFESWILDTRYIDRADWSVIDGNRDDQTFKPMTKPQICVGFRQDLQAPLDAKINRSQWLVSPRFAIPSDEPFLCTFKVYTLSNPNVESFSVWISTGDKDSASFECIQTSMDIVTSERFVPITIDLSSYRGKDIYIAVKQDSKLTSFSFKVDDFEVKKAELAYPTKFMMTSVGKNQMGFSWSGTAPFYRLAYSNLIDDPSLGNMNMTEKSSEKQKLITGLIAGSRWFVYVQAVYADGKSSAWVGPIQVVLPCGTNTLPIVESFDSWYVNNSKREVVDKPIGCWRYIDQAYPNNDSALNASLQVQANLTTALTNSASNRGMGILTLAGTKDTLDRYLITPQFRMPLNGAIMSYWISPSNAEVYYSIKLSTTGNRPEDFVYTLYTDTLKGTSTNWSRRIVELRDKSNNLFPDSLVYIAIQLNGKNSSKKAANFRLDNLVIGNVVSCSMPDSALAEDFAENAVKIHWKSNASSYELVYHTSSFVPDNETGIGLRRTIEGDGSGGSIVLEQLTGGTTYTYWIRSMCEDGKNTLWSGPYSFKPSCPGGIREFPYVTDFNAGVVNQKPDQSSCWTTYSTGTEGFTLTLSGSPEAARVNSLAAFSKTGKYNNQLYKGVRLNNWLRSPKIEVPAEENFLFSFNYSLGFSLTDQYTSIPYKLFPLFPEEFYVLVSTTTSDPSSFVDTLLYVNELPIAGKTAANIMERKVVDLSKYRGEDIYVAIVHCTANLTTFNNYSCGLVVDDLELRGTSCPFPTHVEQLEVSTQDSVEVSWEGASSGGWWIQSSNERFDPYLEAGTVEHIGDVNKHTMKIKEREQLVYYLRADCEEGKYWMGPYSAQYPKNVSELPYVEDFETWTHFPRNSAGWTLLDEDQNGVPLATNSALTVFGQGRSSKGAVGIYYDAWDAFYTEEAEFFTHNNWMISPELDLSSLVHPMLEFWCKAPADVREQRDYEEIDVYIATVPDPSVDDFELLDNFSIRSGQWELDNDVWNRVYLDLSEYAGSGFENIHIAIRHKTDRQRIAFFLVDDFSVRDIGTCIPIEELKVIEIGTDTAVISWRYEGEVDQFQLLIRGGKGSFSYDQQTGLTIVEIGGASARGNGVFEYTLRGLSGDTEYDFYIRPLCSDTNIKAYRGPFYFKTEGAVIRNYPYIETFSNLLPQQDRNFKQWTTLNPDQDMNRFMANAPDGVMLFEMPKYRIAQANDWLLSPALLFPSGYKMSFSYKTGYYGKEDFELYIGKKQEVRKPDGSFDFTKFEKLKSFSVSATRGAVVNCDTLSALANYVGEEVFIAFRVSTYGDSINPKALSFDNFKLSTVDPCVLAPSEVKTLSYTDSVYVSWLSEAAGFRLAYWEVGTTDTLWVDVVGKEVILKNLSPNYTNYGLLIRASCDERGGMWSALTRFETEPRCRQIQSLSTIKGVDTVTLRWVGGYPAAIGYEIAWVEGGSDLYNSSYVSDESWVLRELKPESEYMASVRRICAPGDTSRAVDVIFRTLYTCTEPVDLTVESVGKKEVTLSWKTERASGCTLAYKKEGNEEWEQLELGNVNSYTLRDLVPGTLYKWKIIAECQQGNYSPAAEAMFTTLDPTYYQLSVNTNQAGSGEIVGAGLYVEEQEVEISAIPNDGYQFLYWEDIFGNQISNESTYRFVLVSDTVLTAVFSKNCVKPYQLRVLSVLPDSCLLVWEGDATSYLLFYKTIDEMLWKTIEVEGKQYLLNILEDQRTYQWKVSSLCEARESEATLGDNFLTVGINPLLTRGIRVHFFPNPVRTNASIRLVVEGASGSVELSLVDMLGRIVKRQNFSGLENLQLDMSGIPSGIYILQMRGKNWEKTERLMVE